MSYLLEILGRGRIGDMQELFRAHLAPIDGQTLEQLKSDSVAHPDRPDLQARLGVAWLHRFRLTDAIDCFKQALRAQPDYLLPRLGLACCYEHQDRDRLAVEQLELAHVHAPGEPAVLMALGYCRERLGQPERAAEYYRDLLARAPRTTAARQRLAAIDLAADRIEQAIEHYERLRADSGGGDPSVRQCLANLYLKAGRPRDAVEEFSAAIALAPENWSARQGLADTLVEAGQYRQAIEQLQALLSRQGDFADLHVQLADVHARIGEDEPALAHYQAALEINRDYLEAAVKLATHQLRLGRFADAAVGFNRAVEINDRALTAYVGLAVAQKNAGQLPAAIDTLELAGSLVPNSTLLFREMARLELKAALARQGETVFSAAFAAGQSPAPPADADDGWDELLDLQIERHRQAVRERPSHADLHYRLGLLLAGQGDVQGAVEHYRQACAINPSYTKARIKLGLALKEAGLNDQAAAELSAALSLNPRFADVHYQLGLIYRDQERLAEAADRFEQSLKINGSNPEVRANLAACLESMGLIERASAEWQRLADDARHPATSGLGTSAAPPDSPQALSDRRRLRRLCSE